MEYLKCCKNCLVFSCCNTPCEIFKEFIKKYEECTDANDRRVNYFDKINNKILYGHYIKDYEDSWID